MDGKYVTCMECEQKRNTMIGRIDKLTVAHAVTIGLEIMIVLLVIS